MEILCFAAGMLFFYTKNFFSFLFLLICIIFRPKFTIILAFILAIVYSSFHNSFITHSYSGAFQDNKVLYLKGEIISFPKVMNSKTQFIFKSMNDEQILVSCYQNCKNLKINQKIKAKIKLRKPRNFLNPGSFDYVNFLRARHIYWLGSCKKIKILDTSPKCCNYISLLKQKLLKKLEVSTSILTKTAGGEREKIIVLSLLKPKSELWQ